MKTKILVGLLSDGGIHSGESLAHQLGVSRTAVWKQIRRAIDQGVRIETIRGKGYRLAESVDLLDGRAILAGLAERGGDRLSLSVFDSIDSTNAAVMRAEQRPGIVPICIADSQSAGRGRRGRAWQSPAGQNLYLSLGLEFGGGFSALDGLSLVFGVALAEALEHLGLADVQLKWPNDVFLDGRKLAGILVELQGELEEGRIQVVAGIGLNVHMAEAPEVDQAWTSLAKEAPERSWSRNEVAAAVIASVLAACEEFSSRGFSAFRERWQRRDLFFGRSLSSSQGQLAGLGRGLDADGSYLIELADGAVTAVRAGEISLRAAS
ncbi:biotin--[acetyl-CoA-carboxylase] ligase [Marinobacter sp. SS21]|uniref:biotin--[acetyl-CoA-carboxylase] ligase n=1 Tax=Marinobacter sp. SS21 TaxID=2979460 RepID=UPI00232B8F7B|nr:biotin--[acetyl-CoA-carboxylase] ligase [Marinobacter sp. SS21]MDC0663253.1 biotin--[acetyl-CoA-carboxylase] ligase [Marinobacter sp. SS21]